MYETRGTLPGAPPFFPVHSTCSADLCKLLLSNRCCWCQCQLQSYQHVQQLIVQLATPCFQYFKQQHSACSADLCQLLLSTKCCQCQPLALLAALAGSYTAGSSAISMSSQPCPAFYFLFFRTEGFRKDTHKHQYRCGLESLLPYQAIYYLLQARTET